MKKWQKYWLSTFCFILKKSNNFDLETRDYLNTLTCNFVNVKTLQAIFDVSLLASSCVEMPLFSAGSDSQ